MIRRLLELKIEDFRSYGGAHVLPLDADVVLVHGPNGSGKTSLLSALECAVTGDVQDLQVFRQDYPRCLINDQGSGQAKLLLTFETAQRDGKTLAVNITHPAREAAPRHLLTKEDRRLFSERSYLSQMRLGRLLEKYQNDDEGRQPLIQLLEELLGLDLLENLSRGLHDAGDTRRIEKSCPSLVLFKEQEKALPRRLRELEQRSEQEQQALSNLIGRYHSLAAQVTDPSTREIMTTGSDWELNRRAMKERVNELEDSLRKSQQSMAKLDLAKRLLDNQAVEEDRERLSVWRLQAEMISGRQGDLAWRLVTAVRRIEGHEGICNPAGAEADPLADPCGFFDRFRTHLSNERDDIQSKLDADGKTKQALQTTGHQLEEDRKAVSGLQSYVEDRVKAHEWSAMLHAALRLMEGEVCPLCDRDYGEMETGSLHSHLARKLGQLGADMKRWEVMQSERAQREARIQELEQRTKALEEGSLAGKKIDSLRERHQEIEGLLKRTAEMDGERQEWLDLDLRKKEIEREIAGAESRLEHHSKGLEIMKDLAEELRVASEQSNGELKLSPEKLAEEFQQRTDAIEQEKIICEQLIDCLSETDRTERRIAQVSREISGLHRSIEEIEKARKEIDSVITRARRVSQAVTHAKKHVLDRFLSRTFNDLWLDLYRRLARTERFEPRLSEPVARRGQVSARIQGIARGSEPFEQLASVVSSGNLNTAALSLFLALHLIDEPRMPLLVLDDPVQNMDDVHVVEMTNLLRSIVHQAHRQLILAVHERAMFEYLSLELSPSRLGDSLITVELTRDVGSGATSIQSTRHPWRQDSVSFGT